MRMNKLVVGGVAAVVCSQCLAAAPSGMAALPAKTVVYNWDRSLSWFTGWWLNDGLTSLPETASGQIMPWFDFGAPRTIQVMELGTYNNNNNNDRLRGCVLQTSDDNENWTTVYTIPNDYTFPVSSLVQFEIPEYEPTRYARFYKTANPFNMYVTEFVLYSSDVTISTDRPVVWTEARALESPVPAGGVKVSGALSTTAQSAMHLYAYAAKEDCGNDLAAWQTKAEESLDLGEVEPGAAFTGSFTRLAKGKFYWRVFGVSGEVSVVSQPTVAFVTGCDLFYPKAYVAKEASAVVYDGSIDDNGSTGTYVVFDLRTLPETYDFASIRFFPREQYAERTTLGNQIKFGYETEPMDWTSYVTKEIRGEGNQRPTWAVSALPEGIIWQDVQDPLYTVCSASDDKVCELAVELPNNAKPDYLYVEFERLSVNEIELRVLTDAPPPHIHSYGAWVTNKVVSAGVPGERSRSCEGCGSVEREVLSPLPNPSKEPRPLPAKMIVQKWNRSLASISGWWLTDGLCTDPVEMPAADQIFPWHDFGSPHVVAAMELGTYKTDNNNERLRGCVLQTSDDNENWTTVYTIPSDYVFPKNEAVRFEIPACAPARYARFAKEKDPNNMFLTEFVLYSTDVTIATDRPVVWSAARQLESPVPAGGVRVSGRLLDTPPAAMHLYAYAANEDCGNDRGVWQATAEEVLDLGELQPGAAFTNYFSKVRRGRHFWRVFGVSGDVVVPSQPTVAFVTGGKIFRPQMYVAAEGSAAAYDGSLNTSSAGGSYAVFDLRSLPDNREFASLRCFPRTGGWTYRTTMENEIKFGYETETTDWTTYVTKEIRGADSAYPASVISGIPAAIEWRDVQDPLYTVFGKSDEAVCELVANLPKDARPDYLYVKMNRFSADEFEFRSLRCRSGLVLIVR